MFEMRVTERRSHEHVHSWSVTIYSIAASLETLLVQNLFVPYKRKKTHKKHKQPSQLII